MKAINKSQMNHPFSSLKYKNFRYYWIGMCVSLIGTWMQNIAQPWLAYSLTESPFLLSLVGTLQFMPVLLFSLFSGVIIDRFPKKKILLFTQSCSLIITLILALLVSSGHIQYWHILVMATLLGFVNTLDMPTRHSFIIELVEKDNLMNAIALNSMAFNLARIIGPTIAGLIMGYYGIAVCFFINSLSFSAVIVGLLFTKPINKPIKQKNRKVLPEIREGLRYVRNDKILLSAIGLVAIVGTFAPNFSVLVPVFTKEILNQNETYFGIIMSFMGIGSFIGALSMATLSKFGPRRKVLFVMPVVIGILLMVTSFTNHYILTGFTMSLIGFFFITFSSNSNTLIQLTSDDEHRGRVMSIYTLVFAGSTPIGNLFAGFFTEHYGARIGFIACGAAILLFMIPVLTISRKKTKFELQ